MSGIIAGGLRTPDGMPVVAQSAYAYSAEGARFRGQLCPVPAAGTYSFDLRLEQAVRLQGGFFWSRGASVGDTVTLQVVDVDDILGRGAGTVLTTYVDQMPLAPFDYNGTLDSTTAGQIAAGLYLRVQINHTGAPSALGVTYRWFEVAS
jgi:hypothetical protein